MILAHAATNVLNDYFDFRHGVDVKGAPTTLYRRHPLVEQDFTTGYILGLSIICYIGAALIGIYLGKIRPPLHLFPGSIVQYAIYNYR